MLTLNSAIFTQVVETARQAAQDSPRWLSAINKAAQYLPTCPWVEWDGHTLLVASPQSGETYEANGECQCIAYVGNERSIGGQPCWHRAGARLMRRYDEALAIAASVPTLPAEEPVAAGTAIPNGYYTVIIDEETYYTLKVEEAPEKFGRPGTQMISYLAGSDNESDYRGCAFLSNSQAHIWRRFHADSQLSYAVHALTSDPKRAARLYVLQSGRCFICGRLLTTPQSITLGIGPICAKRIENMGWNAAALKLAA